MDWTEVLVYVGSAVVVHLVVGHGRVVRVVNWSTWGRLLSHYSLDRVQFRSVRVSNDSRET